MDILLISASPRKARSGTWALAKHVVRGLGPQARVETVHLRDLKIGFCTHCEACHVACMRCPVKDDVHDLLEKILAADGIILAAPNYINQVPAALKAVLDRSSHFIHCKRLSGKYLCAVVTSGSGTKDGLILDYLRHYANICGAQFSGGVTACARAVQKKAAEAVRFGARFSRDISQRRRYPAQIRAIRGAMAHFANIVGMRKDHWRGEYAYWKERGWL
ncbi:MAG: NAD(P)H-dependent oxidoreductase [Elusimicrobia bacterium]|nr:NAD(P)H-dependent oxidoreductase [Elusimicrobiota bacterium]